MLVLFSSFFFRAENGDFLLPFLKAEEGTGGSFLLSSGMMSCRIQSTIAQDDRLIYHAFLKFDDVDAPGTRSVPFSIPGQAAKCQPPQ